MRPINIPPLFHYQNAMIHRPKSLYDLPNDRTDLYPARLIDAYPGFRSYVSWNAESYTALLYMYSDRKHVDGLGAN